jgi:[protein-PII] uridylyltransferase
VKAAQSTSAAQPKRRFGSGPGEFIEAQAERLRQHDENIADRYWSRHNVEDLLRERSRFLDEMLTQVWLHTLSRQAQEHLCLLAVGGYGRGEQFPHSDVDLLILAKRPSTWGGEIRTFLQSLYDLKLDIGHSVRSLPDCKREAQKDITVATSMYERRYLIGSKTLATKLDKVLSAPRLWPPDKFFKAKRDEQEARHRQFDNVEYGLEPNLKASPGGLRDLQTAMWVCQRQFGTTDPRDLEKIGALTQQEKTWFLDGRRFLWWVRFGLHLLAGRKEDRLQFEYQRGLARKLGFADTSAKRGVERFMKLYYQHVLALREVNEIVFQYFEESILRGKEKPKIEAINDRFQIRNNYMEACHEQVFRDSPTSLIEIFVIMANRRDISGVRAATIRLIRDHLHLIDDEFRKNPIAAKLFMDLLKAPYTLVSQLTRMRRYGVLGQYLPEYGEIVGQMQHDLFHIYTVDAHTMMVIRNMRRFHYRSSEEQFPVACHCVRSLPKIELLYVAGLYHDVGKGRGGNHSELGASDVVKFCVQHGLTKDDTELVAWLVKQHLMMSSTAQRKDIYDPDIIFEFATEVKSVRRLDYLYALTVADINATNPTLWNSWRAALLRQLYGETKKALRRGLESPVDKQATIRACQESALEKLLQGKLGDGICLTEDLIRNIWKVPSDDYFLRHTPRQVAELTELMVKHDPQAAPLVVVHERKGQVSNEGATEVSIYVADRQYLFASTVAAFNQLGLSVYDASIHTSHEGLCLNTFIVLDEKGKAPTSRQSDRDALQSQLTKILSATGGLPSVAKRRLPRQLKQLPTTTIVKISNATGTTASELNLITADRPGLLASVGLLFAELGLSVLNARITTLGERVEDVFSIHDRSGLPITSKEEIYLLENTIRQRLDSQLANER